MEASPEEKRDNGERQAHDEVYLDGVEMSIRVRRLRGCTVRLEDGGAHERLKKGGNFGSAHVASDTMQDYGTNHYHAVPNRLTDGKV